MEKTKVLIVEGKEDQSLVCALLKKINGATIKSTNPKEVKVNNKLFLQVYDADGVDNAKIKFKQFIKDRDQYETVGLMVDLDSGKEANIQSRWQFFKDTAKESYGYSVPDRFDNAALMFESIANYPKIGLWLMPDNATEGMLEDFAIKLIKEDDILIAHSNDIVIGLPEKRFRPSYNSKAILHTWLAWQEYPNADIWRGFDNNYFDVTNQLCVGFMHWIEEMYK